MHLNTLYHLFKYNHFWETTHNFLIDNKSNYGYSLIQNIGNPIIPNLTFKDQVSESLKWASTYNTMGTITHNFIIPNVYQPYFCIDSKAVSYNDIPR